MEFTITLLFPFSLNIVSNVAIQFWQISIPKRPLYHADKDRLSSVLRGSIADQASEWPLWA